jgi:hypothetical protein
MPSWSTRKGLPTGPFPVRVERGKYACDVCGADVTKSLPARNSHGITIGPETFRCACGKVFKTGAMEWDHLGPERKGRWIRGTVYVTIFGPPFFAVAGLVFGFVTNNSLHNAEAGFLWGLTLGGALAGYVLLRSVSSIIVSRRRTRIGLSTGV